jgi:salicylate hydroxylase
MTESKKVEKPVQIAIVGAGIGGLATAIACLKQGVAVQLFEAASAYAPVGAGVVVSPNAIAAMQKIDPSIHEYYLKHMTTNYSPEKKHLQVDVRLGEVSGNFKWVADIKSKSSKIGLTSIHRAQYLNMLQSHLPKDFVQFSKKVVDVVDLGDDGVKLQFEDTTTTTVDAVIACDGIRSDLRGIILANGPSLTAPVFSGRYAYRGLIPMEDARRIIGDELARDGQMYIGPDRNVIMYPINDGKTVNISAFKTKEDGQWDSDNWVLPVIEDDVKRDFQGWAEPIQRMIALSQDKSMWGVFEAPHASTFYRGRICMLGDAAHAMTPHAGAGAGLALEDAFILSNLLGLVGNAADIEKAFAAYDAVQRPRTQEVSRVSRDAGLLFAMDLDGVKDDLHKIRETLSHIYEFIWAHDLDLQLVEAKKVML